MNLMQLLARGAAHAEASPRYTVPQLRAINATRRQWLNALLVDQTRAWMDLGERQPEVLTGLAVVLTCAGFVEAHDAGADTPRLRVIRGAISAAEQCAQQRGNRIQAADAKAFSAAARHAAEIIQAGTPAAIVHAAGAIRATVGL